MLARRLRRYAVMTSAALVAGAAIAACGSSGGSSAAGGSSSGGGSSKGPIKVGQISSLTGGYPFSTTPKGTQAYFNYVNAHGGVDGHKIQFQSGDDQGSASQASQLAHKFVLQNHVVAMVGNTSIPDCPTNAAFYKQMGIGVIAGGTEPICFTTSNIQPVNAGPYIGHEVEWKYTFSHWHPKKACMIDQNDPTSVPTFERMVSQFEAQNHVHFAEVTYTNDATVSPVPAVTHAKQVGCDVVMMSTTAPNFVAFIKAAKEVGLDATFMDDGAGYDTSIPKTLGALGKPGALGPDDKGVFVAAELAPATDPNPNIKLMAKTLSADHITDDFWAEIGWLSAFEFVDALKQGAAKGDNITTASGVLTALKAMKPVNTGYAATDEVFGPGTTHAPNLGSEMLQVKGNSFAPASGDNGAKFTVVPPVNYGSTK
jgi:branched-chain amino acid transport system substrate-binding protein